MRFLHEIDDELQKEIKEQSRKNAANPVKFQKVYKKHHETDEELKYQRQVRRFRSLFFSSNSLISREQSKCSQTQELQWSHRLPQLLESIVDSVLTIYGFEQLVNSVECMLEIYSQFFSNGLELVKVFFR